MNNVKDVKTQLKDIKKSFAQLESKLQEVDSDSNSDNHSLFQYNFWHQV